MVLPAPFAPTSPVTPVGTMRSSPSSALVDGNSITKPRVSMIAGIRPSLAAPTRPFTRTGPILVCVRIFGRLAPEIATQTMISVTAIGDGR